MHGDRRHKPDAGETAVGRPRAAYVEGDTRVQVRLTFDDIEASWPAREGFQGPITIHL